MGILGSKRKWIVVSETEAKMVVSNGSTMIPIDLTGNKPYYISNRHKLPQYILDRAQKAIDRRKV